ncbi:MAG: hypothetical protein A2X58_12550 [Nitrospirae bacterium GWC2_56_14]|nr:MAG: hypothetical protein A2X58_12550 [Nitrospirae bacterium GWC2_56_14]
MNKNYENMTIEELQKELSRLRENLCDIEDQHSFTFVKTSVHIGAEKAQNMQEEYEQECREHTASIAELETILKARGAL